jgi:hypothetical protein
LRGGGTGPGIIIFDGCRWWEDGDLRDTFSGKLGSWGAGSEVIGGGSGGVCGGEAISIIGSGIAGCDASGSKYAASGKLDCEGGRMGGTFSSDVVLGGNKTAPSRYVSLEGGVIEGALLSARDVGDEGSSATSLKPSRYMEIASSTLMPSSIP